MVDLTDVDILNMDDDEFLKTNPDPSLAQTETVETAETPENTETAEITAENTDGETTEETSPETPSELDETEEQKLQRERDEQGRFKKADTEKKPEDVAKAPEGEKKDDKTTVENTTEDKNPAQHKLAGYDKIMAPFKANGKTIELKTPEEAIQLMQMGANYTRKMQELAPHRKVLTMLQNNGLLDEGKLSYLIDLDKKNPDAIKKLVKDAGIDPMEIDVNAETAYRDTGNHRVSDEEVGFHSALEDMKSTPEKMETLKVIHDGWDRVSQEALWKNPAIMAVIHEQRENGIYTRIANEVARRQVLGAIPANVPFLQAYKVVGDEMAQANTFASSNPKPTPTPTEPIVTRVQAPKPKVVNGEKAAAVSPNRSTPSNKKPLVNFLEMSDEDFENFKGRV